MTLDKLPIGKKAKITAVGGEGELRLRLLDMGLTPRTAIMIRKIAPMGDPVELHLRGYELSIRLEDARQIEVEEVEA
jgi:Fe2+ transport system protein FeoA